MWNTYTLSGKGVVLESVELQETIEELEREKLALSERILVLREEGIRKASSLEDEVTTLRDEVNKLERAFGVKKKRRGTRLGYKKRDRTFLAATIVAIAGTFLSFIIPFIMPLNIPEHMSDITNFQVYTLMARDLDRTMKVQGMVVGFQSTALTTLLLLILRRLE